VAILAIALVFAVTACGSSGGSGTSDTSGPIKLGGVFDLTGTAAAFGTAFERSAQIAFNEVNAKGGINGREIEMNVLDDQSDPATAVAVTNKLIDEGNQIIFGGIYTPIAIAVAKTAVDHHALMYSPGSGAEQLSSPVQKLVFAPTPTHEGISRSVAALTASLKPSKIGFLEMTDTEGEDDRTSMEKLLTEYNLELSDIVSIDENATDATSQILKFKEAGDDVIVSSGLSEVDTVLLKAEIAQNVFIPIVDEGGGNEPAVLELAASNPNITYYTSSPLGCPMGGPCTKEFLSKWGEHYPPNEASLYAAEGYGTALAFVAALEETEDYAPEKLAETLETMPAFENEILPTPIKFSPTQHVGMTHVAMTGYVKGKETFVDPEVKE
jgi:branched-chain amino acid transport system substrate-binding protein